MKKLQNIWPYIKQFKMNSIFLRTFLLISLLIIVPFLIVSIIFYSSNLNTMHEEIEFENSSMLDSSANIIDSTLMECDMMSSSIASNESAQMFTINNISTDSFKAVTGLTKTLPIVYKYIDSVYLYSEPYHSVIINENAIPISEFNDMDWLDSYHSINTQQGVIIPRNKNNTYPPLITIIKPIYVADEKKGAVIMNINSQIMYNSMLYKRYKDGRLFFFIDSQNRVIMTNNVEYLHMTPSDIGFNPIDIGNSSKTCSCDINGAGYLFLSSDSLISNFKYISAYPRAIYENRLSMFRLQIAETLFLLLIIVFILAYVASIKSYTPLHEILSSLDEFTPSMNNIGAEDKNELMYIINNIHLHIEDKTKMEEILEERMKLLRQTQYDMLQTQINPHFLYNTLETINWMAYNMSNSDNPVSKSLVNLASFFRNTVSSGYFVSIRDEIKYTKEYINILSLRYGDLFDLDWDIDETILSYSIIKICLQPIIENAVYHGIKPKNQKGLIKITGRCDKENIILTVSDNGVGMDAETVQNLNIYFQNNTYDQEKSHIGLDNVNKRIKIIFGENYGISVQSILGEGTDVQIKIPIERQK